jgi:choline transport protein
MNITYTIPQLIVAVRGRDILPPRPFALSKPLGLFCNIFSPIWVLLYVAIFCFPTFIPVTAQSMNFLSVIAVGALLFIGLSWWLGKRKTFTGPDVVIDGVRQSSVVSGKDAGGVSGALNENTGDRKTAMVEA